MLRHIFLAFSLLTISCSAFANDFSYTPGQDQNIEIENRVLLKINNKAITVMDIVHKMDLLFYRQYPQFSGSEAARYQFYTASWQTILQMVIDEELMLADAEEKKVDVSDGELRQEMEHLFGPEVVFTLDRINLTFDDASDMVRRELIVQKMNGAFVNMRAMADIHPKKIRESFQKRVAETVPENLWKYQYISIRGETRALVEQVANDLFLQLQSKKNIEKVVESVQEVKGVVVRLSEPSERLENDLSLVHLKELKKLDVGQISMPTMQTSKSKSSVYRIFALHGFEEGRLPTLAEVENEIKQQLMQEAMVHHAELYKNKLREHYGMTEKYLAGQISEELQPFAMR